MAAAEQLTIIRNALASLSCQCCLRVCYTLPRRLHKARHRGG